MNSPDELFDTSEPFCTQNSKFVMGKGYTEEDMLMKPEPFANQLIYASSAGRTDQYFFKKYRECSIRMDAGDKRYFCADVSCDVILNATKHGVKLPFALLTQDKIDSAMRKNKEAAMREYKNIFTSEGSEKQIISRASIIKNSYPYLPILYNDLSEQDVLYGIAYDPARRRDNSAVLIGKFYKDKDVGWRMSIVNCILLMELFNKKKKNVPMTTPNQIEALKEIILDYNGRDGVADYENILGIWVDAGSGGAGIPITDFLCEDWVDSKGKAHKGLIDPEFNEGDDRKFPNAIKDKLHLVSPVPKNKAELFEAAIKVVDEGLVDFPEEYMNKGYVNILYEVDEKGRRKPRMTYPSEKEEKEMTKKHITIDTVKYNLDDDEEASLCQIDAMKTEVVNIYRFENTSGVDRFDLAPDKANILNDDRAYCFSLLCRALADLRRESVTNRRRQTTSGKTLVDMLPITTGSRRSLFEN